MNTQSIPQEEVTEEEQERVINQLRQSIQLSHHQMHQLVSNQEQFVQKITNFNNISIDKIYKKSQLQISEALVYLAQAQKVLQYAAGCGKNINRELIMCILHNQACVYQILWELDQCQNYLQALIYNCQLFYKETTELSVPPSCINPTSTSQINFQSQKMFGFAGGSQVSYVSRLKNPYLISRTQLKLLNYYFQHCAISSQLQKNRKAMQSSKKAIKILQNSFYDQKTIFIQEMQLHKTNSNENIQQKYHLLQNLSQLSEKMNIDQFQQIIESTHLSLQLWTKNRTFNNNSQVSGPQKNKRKQKLKNLAIGTIMQILPKQFNKLTNQAICTQDQQSIFSLQQYLLRVFFLSVGYFSVATQLRILASKNNKQQEKKNSQQYKESMIYHLIAIIIASLYIPYDCRYILDILASYSKHYCCNLEQYKPAQQQPVRRICELLGVKQQEKSGMDTQRNQKLVRSIKQSSHQQKIVQANDYNMNFRNNLVIKNKVYRKKEELHNKQSLDLQNQKDKLKKTKKTRVDSEDSKMKRSTSRQTLKFKQRIQKKYSQLQKIISSDNLKTFDEGQKLPLKKLKSAQKYKQKNQHMSKGKIYTKKECQKQKDDIKTKKTDNKKIKTQRKQKNFDKKQDEKYAKSNTVTEYDQQFFFYMTKKTTKTNKPDQNGDTTSPKQSIRGPHRSTSKKSRVVSSRSHSKNISKVLTNLQSPTVGIQSPIGKGFINLKKANIQRKSPNPKINILATSASPFLNYY